MRARVAVQLPLPLTSDGTLSFDLFEPGPNREIVHCLRGIVDSPRATVVYLWGDDGCGKTHLLQALCRGIAEQGGRPVYIPLAQAERFSPKLLEGLETTDGICIDDIDAICGDQEWEQGIFHLYNQARTSGRPVVVSANRNPRTVGMERADLRTRLGWGLVFQLRPLSDEDKMGLLKRRAHARGLELPRNVAEFMLNKLPRDVYTLCTTFDKLDQAALVAQRRLTIPFVRDLLDGQSKR